MITRRYYFSCRNLAYQNVIDARFA